jgi:hypothetical protein
VESDWGEIAGKQRAVNLSLQVIVLPTEVPSTVGVSHSLYCLWSKGAVRENWSANYIRQV